MLANILFIGVIVAVFAARVGATILVQREQDPILRNVFRKGLSAI